MGVMGISHFFAKRHPNIHQGLTDVDQHHLSDVERIAKTLAKQGGAPADEWPFFVEPAEALVRLSMRWTTGC
jgi:hypothetical protein